MTFEATEFVCLAKAAPERLCWLRDLTLFERRPSEVAPG